MKHEINEDSVVTKTTMYADGNNCIAISELKNETLIGITIITEGVTEDDTSLSIVVNKEKFLKILQYIKL